MHLATYARAAAKAARQAGDLQARYIGSPRTVETKRSAADLVTEVDRNSERIIQRALRKSFPRLGFLGEERGEYMSDASTRWIVDPLDGTTNFVHGIPFFGVSIGMEHEGELLVGVIYDPIRRELFMATRGGGAFRNGKRLSVSRVRILSRSILSTGFPQDFRLNPHPSIDWFSAFESRTHAVRRMGSTALSLAYVASGRIDCFYESHLRPWDIAAGILLVKEAGGRVSDLAGGPAVLTDGRLIASNAKIHTQVIRQLKRTRYYDYSDFPK